jgi:hypothetical protein
MTKEMVNRTISTIIPNYEPFGREEKIERRKSNFSRLVNDETVKGNLF